MPTEFLRNLGEYVASCAHIEWAAWLLCLELKGLDPHDKDQFDKTRPLLKKPGIDGKLSDLKNAASTAPHEIQGRIREVCKRIEAGTENRHMAIHGAWQVGNLGDMSVTFFKNFGDSKQADWRDHSQTIDADYIAFALNDANEILVEVYGIREAVSEWKKTVP
ncbi:hypothetical protein [Anianabacter salinae]|uniref:hypothetical protein n=1 Tax=Anianabacter salinae TaxID=2851023 RepID=UPI00225DD6DD|nr:hypothetical protein [Anianabacter salinae]MBV0911379.1 hypothetical protein [Anianabacter salinae]